MKHKERVSKKGARRGNSTRRAARGERTHRDEAVARRVVEHKGGLDAKEERKVNERERRRVERLVHNLQDGDAKVHDRRQEEANEHVRLPVAEAAQVALVGHDAAGDARENGEARHTDADARGTRRHVALLEVDHGERLVRIGETLHPHMQSLVKDME